MADTSEARDLLLNQLADEFAARYRQGERPSLREYCDRHPELADDIREYFPALAELERAKADARPELAVAFAGAPSVTQLGDFRLLREVGRGGMGVVYEAEQVSLSRRVAIKLLPATVFRDPTKRRRFEREAKAAAKLHHTNIVPVHGFGEHDGTPYYVMQFIPGLGLDAVIDELARFPAAAGRTTEPGPATAEHNSLNAALAHSLLGDLPAEDAPTMTSAGGNPPGQTTGSRSDRSSSVSMSASGVHLPGQSRSGNAGPAGTKTTYWESVARIGVQVAGALAYAHKLGILHRDIKPANLLLDLDGIVWVTDFGLAKADDADDLTHTGDVLGTLRYMPPESFEGRSDARSDIYALGLTLFELVALRPAYDERDKKQLIKQVTTGNPPRLRKLRKDAPRDLLTIIEKAIEKDPARRYQTAGALGDDLQRFLEDRPVRARRVSETERLWRWCRRNPLPASLLAGIVLVFLTGFAGVFWQWREAETAREDEKRQRDRADALRQGAETARDEADQARAAAEKASVLAQAETYQAVLSEVRALRAGHQPGWREKALEDLARLAVMPTLRRDLPELRTEAAATLGTPDIDLVARVELPSDDLGSFTFSRDGCTLLTAGSKTGLDFWDVAGKRHLSSVENLAVGESGFDKVVYLPNGQGLAVGTDQGIIFTDNQGARTPRAPIIQGSSKPTTLSISANGQRMAVAWTGVAGITVHDVASGEIVEQFKDSTSPFTLSPDGRWLARAENTDIVLLPIASREPRIVLGRHGGATALDFSPDGTMLAAAFRDHTTVIWDVVKRERIGTLRGHRERVLDVAFSPDGGWIATASLDYTIRIWDTRTGQNVATLPSAPVRRVQWSPTGEYLATSTRHSSRDVFLYRITGRYGVQQWLTGHKVELRCVAAHPRLERLATSGYTELMSWDLSVPRPSPVAFEPNSGAVTALAYSPDGSLLATASWPQNANPREVVVRDANTGKVRGQFSSPQIVNALAFDPTGERLVCGDAAGNVVVWDLATGRPVQQFATGSAVYSIIYLDRPRSLVTHGKDAVLLFSLESGKLERKVDFAGGGIRKLVADQARSRLVVGFQNGALGSLSLPDLTPGPRLEKAHAGSVDCLALSPDGRLLVTGGADHRVVLHDAMSFERLLEFPVWAGELRELTFDSKGRRLAIVGTDSDVDLWDLAALSDGLVAVGLAWDRPATAVVPAPGLAPEGKHLRPATPVIRRPG